MEPQDELQQQATEQDQLEAELAGALPETALGISSHTQSASIYSYNASMPIGRVRP